MTPLMRALTLWLLFALPAAAQDLPALYDVTGVAANDTLNVRSTPDSGGAVLGTLVPNARGIEVIALSDTGRWGRINLDESSGWVAMAFLRPQFPGVGPLPAQFTCFGTEPFWRLDVQQNGQSHFGDPMQDPRAFDTGAVITGAGRSDIFAIAGQGLSLTMQRQTCTDGMSDRQYGLSVNLLVTGDTLYGGCCTLGQ